VVRHSTSQGGEIENRQHRERDELRGFNRDAPCRFGRLPRLTVATPHRADVGFAMKARVRLPFGLRDGYGFTRPIRRRHFRLIFS